MKPRARLVEELRRKMETRDEEDDGEGEDENEDEDGRERECVCEGWSKKWLCSLSLHGEVASPNDFARHYNPGRRTNSLRAPTERPLDKPLLSILSFVCRINETLRFHTPAPLHRHA